MINKSFVIAAGRWPLILISGLSLVAYAGLASVDRLYGTLRAGFTPRTIAWYLLAFIAYLGLLIWAEKHALSKRWIWAGAVLFRAILLTTTPTLSDDVYRYLWDGYLANEGISPYAHAIDSPDLDHLDIPQRALAKQRLDGQSLSACCASCFLWCDGRFSAQSILPTGGDGHRRIVRSVDSGPSPPSRHAAGAPPSDLSLEPAGHCRGRPWSAC